MGTIDAGSGSQTRGAKRLGLLLLGGLLIGLGTSLPLTIAWPDIMRPPVVICLFETESVPMERIWIKGRVIPLPCQPTFMFIQPIVWGGFLGAGCVFGLIAYELAQRGSRCRLAALLEDAVHDSEEHLRSLFRPILNESLAEIVPGKPMMVAEVGCSERGGDKAAWMEDALLSAVPDRHARVLAHGSARPPERRPARSASSDHGPAPRAALNGPIIWA